MYQRKRVQNVQEKNIEAIIHAVMRNNIQHPSLFEYLATIVPLNKVSALEALEACAACARCLVPISGSPCHHLLRRGTYSNNGPFVARPAAR